MDPIAHFKDGHQSEHKGFYQQKRSSFPTSCVSLKSDSSMDPIAEFKDGHQSEHKGVGKGNVKVLNGQSDPEAQTDLDSIFMLLKENITQFVETELNKFQKVLGSDYQERLENETMLDAVDEDLKKTSRDSFLNIALNFLRNMNQKELADSLQCRVSSTELQQKHKSSLKKRFESVFEGIAKAGNPTLLNQIYTELYITEGGTGEVNDEHEVRQIEKTSWKPHKPETTIRQQEIFQPQPGRNEPIRKVLTKGVAGIGKTVLTQKFTLDWAEDKTNQDIHFLFPFSFRELNVLKETKFSLVELVHHFFSETKGTFRFDEFQVLFIFDGLDECRLPLDFHRNHVLTDVTESTSVDVLLTNLIRGNLLPSARFWITTRPAAANQIPAECVDLVTEVRGFTDPQKEEYFRKKFKDKRQAKKIISHIKTSRSLHIMCHIPVFCWINATVLEDLMKTKGGPELPKTLTELYIHFLMVQINMKKIKYDGSHEMDKSWSPQCRREIESLGKLAFEQLLKGNLIFYESDLTACGIDIRDASVYSGVFTQILREERGLYQVKVFCFVHLSVQEFLAALFVRLTFDQNGVIMLTESPQTSENSVTTNPDSAETQLHQTAVDKALQSSNGHLDLFLRFLLGLSLSSNQSFLHGLITDTGNRKQTKQETIQYIKKKISENLPVEKTINLFHCLNELDDRSLEDEIQHFLRSGDLSTDELSHAQWSALVFILLSSEKDMDLFDLKKYSATEEALRKLLPVVKVSNKAILSGCNLSERSCEALSQILSCSSSRLRELDLSNNKLQDSGVKRLSEGLQSPLCKLESLRLSGCQITDEGCASLASALSCNLSHLKELDLSYNHIGDTGMKVLSSRVEDSNCRLDILRVDHRGKQWLLPGLKKYFCELELNLNTVSRKLRLSNNNRKVEIVTEEQPYPDHPDRFEWNQLLYKNGLTGRCYWEVEWSGLVLISVSYRGIRRTGQSSDSWFGGNDQSWSLKCCANLLYTVYHDNMMEVIPISRSCLGSRVAVYLDHPAGTLSFYRVSSDTLVHLYSFNTTFTEPLYPGFGFWPGSSVTLCSP
ncbi:protein NLRC3 [Austrofundulus limnaeus]|uniref:Protein NLRC3 n=1 Tax=Austrofundulus limnaeus TaxID=52670 RepID=A0A2I4CFJ3_AUSLI|nr:PREDICTED: protein NLRC3-like [Austrofundulus limnaeus]